MKDEHRQQLNLSLRTDLVVPLKQYFAAMGKGALSHCVEQQMSRFLRKKGVTLPETLCDLWDNERDRKKHP